MMIPSATGNLRFSRLTVFRYLSVVLFIVGSKDSVYDLSYGFCPDVFQSLGTCPQSSSKVTVKGGNGDCKVVYFGGFNTFESNYESQ